MSPALQAAVEAEVTPDRLVEAGIYQSAADGFEHGLVVLALGGEYWLVPHNGGFRLLVEPGKLDAVREQLARYDRERLNWPPRPPSTGDTAARPPVLFTPLLWAVAVLAMFWAQSRWPQLTALLALDADAVFVRGEAWRAATALFLHANADHLVSNGLNGIFVFSATCSALGRKRGWLLLGLAATAANLATAALHYPAPYRSLGASTAIFSGLGLLTGRAIRSVLRTSEGRRWRELFPPLASGLTVLALYGAGGNTPGIVTDVGAHAAGFLAGALLGFAGGTRRT